MLKAVELNIRCEQLLSFRHNLQRLMFSQHHNTLNKRWNCFCNSCSKTAEIAFTKKINFAYFSYKKCWKLRKKLDGHRPPTTGYTFIVMLARTWGPRTRIKRGTWGLRTRTCKLVLDDPWEQGLSSRTTTLYIHSKFEILAFWETVFTKSMQLVSQPQLSLRKLQKQLRQSVATTTPLCNRNRQPSQRRSCNCLYTSAPTNQCTTTPNAYEYVSIIYLQAFTSTSVNSSTDCC